MAYECKILADSVNEYGNRLTTFEVTYPRFVHSELLTHRMLSRNSSSSRAIPIQKMIEQVQNDPVLPVWWGKNQSGMQAKEELDKYYQEAAIQEWLMARDDAIENVGLLSDLGLHKQIANRLLEPWMWITVIVSATEWANFFHLRCHPDAQPEIRYIADMMKAMYFTNKPREFTIDAPLGWHLPLINSEDLECWAANDLSTEDLVKISVGRCARVSYLTHDGKRDPAADIDLHDRLQESGHWSPFEHVACPGIDMMYGNFKGWFQYRKRFVGKENYESYDSASL